MSCRVVAYIQCTHIHVCSLVQVDNWRIWTVMFKPVQNVPVPVQSLPNTKAPKCTWIKAKHITYIYSSSRMHFNGGQRKNVQQQHNRNACMHLEFYYVILWQMKRLEFVWWYRMWFRALLHVYARRRFRSGNSILFCWFQFTIALITLAQFYGHKAHTHISNSTRAICYWLFLLVVELIFAQEKRQATTRRYMYFNFILPLELQ